MSALDTSYRATACERRTRAVLLRGAAGIGKSSLLREWSTVQRQRGSLVLMGVADRTDLAPLAALRDAATESMSIDCPPVVRESLNRLHRSLYPTTRVEEAGSQRLSPLAACDDVFAASTQEGLPPSVIIEDVHCADSDTLRLCMDLIRQGAMTPVLVIMSMRPGYDEVTGELTALIERQAERGLAELIELDPLDTTAVTAILNESLPAPPDDAFVKRAEDLTGGNPLLLKWAVQQLLDSPHLQIGKSGRCEVDTSWHPTAPQQLAIRLVAPQANEATLGAALAVIGRVPHSMIGLLASTAGISTQECRRVTDAMVAKGILTATPATLEFSHPLLREAFAALLGPQSKRHTHRQIADYLIEQLRRHRPVDMFEIATHLSIGADSIDDFELDTLIEAAETALSSAPIAAAHWFDTARRLRPASDPRQPEFLGGQLLGFGLASQTKDAIPLIDEGLGTIPPPERPIRLSEQFAGTLFNARRTLEAAAVARQVTGAHRSPWLRAVHSAVLADAWQRDEALKVYDSLFEHLDHSPERRAALSSRFGLHFTVIAPAVYGRVEQVDIAIRWLSEALVDSDTNIRRLHRNMALMFSAGSSEGVKVLRHFENVAPLAATPNQITTDDAGTAAARETVLGYLTGKWDDIAGTLRRRIDSLYSSGNLLAYEYPASLYSYMLTCRGELTESRRLVDTIGEPTGIFFSLASVAKGALLMAEGRYTEGCRLLRDCYEQARTHGVTFYTGLLCDWLCEALCLTKQRSDAARFATDAAEWLIPLNLPHSDIHVYRAIARSTGDLSAARLSAEMATRYTDAFEQARSKTVLAALKVDIEENLASAYEIFTALGASVERVKVESMMRKQGMPVRRSRADANTLTPVEAAIVRLASQGMSNREIARSLSYSPKTVEMHLGRVYSRTGYAGRVATVSAFVNGLLTPLDSN